MLKLTHLSLLINFYPPPPSWPEITIRRCKDLNTFCQWSDGSRVAKTAPDQVFAGQLWILFASLLPTFTFVAVLIPLSTLPSNWIFAEYPTCNTCTLYQGKKSNPAELKQFNSNFNQLSHGKKGVLSSSKKCFFSIRWVLRDTTSLFLAVPSILKTQSLKELCCTTLLQNAFTQGQSRDYPPPLQQSLKPSATVVTQHLTTSSQDRLQNAMSNTMT